MKNINAMDEKLTKWVIDVSIDNGDFKGPAVNEIRITERAYWLEGEAVLGNPGHLANVQIQFKTGPHAEVHVWKVEFDTEKLAWRPDGYWPIYNNSIIIKRLMDEGYKVSPLN